MKLWQNEKCFSGNKADFQVSKQVLQDLPAMLPATTNDRRDILEGVWVLILRF